MSSTRPRGYIECWNPRADTLTLIAAIEVVLNEYFYQLPLTGRQIFYRLVAGGYDKTERAYYRLMETLQKARRADLIAWDAIRDDKFMVNSPHFYDSTGAFVDTVRYSAENMRLDRQEGQQRRLVIWVEARGIQPMVQSFVDKYGIAVYSSGGFDSVTAKRDMAVKLSEEPHEVIHLGDYDPSGVHVFSSLREDVQAFAKQHGHVPVFTRLAVTPEQIAEYALPTAPAKKNDNRSFDGDGTVQLEAFAPDVLAKIVEDAVRSRLDDDAYQVVLAAEQDARETMTARLEGLL